MTEQQTRVTQAVTAAVLITAAVTVLILTTDGFWTGFLTGTVTTAAAALWIYFSLEGDALDRARMEGQRQAREDAQILALSGASPIPAYSDDGPPYRGPFRPDPGQVRPFDYDKER